MRGSQDSRTATRPNVTRRRFFGRLGVSSLAAATLLFAGRVPAYAAYGCCFLAFTPTISFQHCYTTNGPGGYTWHCYDGYGHCDCCEHSHGSGWFQSAYICY